MTVAISQTFIPGPRLIDGSDLNTLVSQANTAMALLGQLQQVANVALTTIGNGTLLAAAIATGLITRSGSTAAFSDTTDTALAIVGAITAPVIGQSFYLTIKNTTAFAETLIGGVGVTLSGLTIIPALTEVRFLVTLTSLTAVAMIGVASGSLVPLPIAQVTANGIGSGSFAATGLGGAATCVVRFTSITAHATQTIPTPASIVATIPNALAGLSYNLELRNVSLHTMHLLTKGSTHTTGLSSDIAVGVTESAVVTLNTLTDITITGTGNSAS